VALGLAWLFTGNRKYLGYIGRVLRFALVVGLVAVLFYVVERLSHRGGKHGEPAAAGLAAPGSEGGR